MVSETKLFNKYSAISILLLLVLPLVYLVPQDLVDNYVEGVDKLSIPVWSAFYAWFWIRFTLKIKKLLLRLSVLQDRADAHAKLANRDYITEEIENQKSLADASTELAEAEQNLEFINVAFRFAIIVVAGLKLLYLFWSVF